MGELQEKPRPHEFYTFILFNLQHMPVDYQHDYDLHDLIRLTACLIVQITNLIISCERPEFWPETTTPYPMHVTKDTKRRINGTGRVTRVKKCWRTCPCLNCRRSHTPSNVWVQVIVLTATHVVFNNLEAENTTCRLFYDSEDSPAVNLYGFRVKTANITDDYCEMVCATCDMSVFDRLDAILKNRAVPRNKVIEKVSRSEKVGKICFIISHPHGLSKQISFGQWKDRYTVREGRGKVKYTKCMYTASTCPGSSGAHVFSLGFDNWLRGHVHSGVNNYDINFSGTGGEVTYANIQN